MIYRVIFEEGEDIRYISHLDLIRTFNRMLFRSGLPIKHSEGFNPHVCLNIALPLPVGVTSLREAADIEFKEDVSLEKVKQALCDSAPGGIIIKEVSEKTTPLFKNIAKSEYEIKVNCQAEKEKIISFLESDEIITPKKTKKGIKDVDIKPLIYGFSIKEEGDYIIITTVLAAGSAQNLNPLLLVNTMEAAIDNFELKDFSVKRIKFMTEDGEVF